MSKIVDVGRILAVGSRLLSPLGKAPPIGLLCLVLLISACGDDATLDDGDGSDNDPNAADTTGSTADSDNTSASGGSSPASDTTEPDYDPGLTPLVDQARTDLAERLGIDQGQITLTLAELRTWPNNANGCPQEGMVYLDAPVDGSEIIFTVDGREYRYTTGGQVFTPTLCE